MAWVPTTSTRENTLTKIGGGPINNIFRYLTKINLGLIDSDLEPKITTPTHFYTRSLRFPDNDDDAEMVFDTNSLNLDAGVNQFITWPKLTNVVSGEKSDTPLFEKQAQTVEGKTLFLSLNHVKATSGAAGDMVSFQDVGSGVIELRRLAHGTAGQVPTVNGTADGIIWATPSAGTVADNSITDAKIASHTSTKITITAKGQLNSQIAYKDDTVWLTNAMVSASAAIGWAKIDKTGSILSDIANVILTTPASQDILVRNGSSQFVNLAKGANNTMLGVNGSGNLAYSTVADTNIASHTSTKITITTKAQLNSALVYNDQANTFGANNQTIPIANLLLSNNANTGAFGVQASLTGARVWSMPNSSTNIMGNDTTDTMTNKTYNATGTGNSLTNVGDSAIASHTSTKITITAKGQLNSAILYNDVDNALGAHYLQIDKISAPGAAPSGKVKLYVDSTSGLFSQID